MLLKPPYYPIIYVRGYAATMSEIEDTVATPYMGFNLGATKIRQDYEGRIVRFIFESPLIRLMKDDGYADVYRDGDVIPETETVPAKSIWIFRYYEPVSQDLGDDVRRSIPQFAADLRAFILRVRDQVCGDDAEARETFKVYLVAHSMGGLICRCYLQNICVNGVNGVFKEPELSEKKERLELGRLPADSLVDKVFTYATPHNGIELAGINVPDIGALDKLQVYNFNRDNMRIFLALPKGDGPVDSLNGAFPVDRFFCFVGTNYRDYSAFFGLSKKGTGPMSDGLVMIKNATVDGAPRAFAHRSHSGHFGIVNSEEGYQNLRRFLFGNVRVDVILRVDEITLPKAIEDAADGDRYRVKAAYNIEAAAALRGLKVFLNERRVAQESALRRTYEELVHDKKPVYLFSGYLLKSAKTPNSKGNALAFALELGIKVPIYEIDRKFWFDNHFEGGQVFQDVITFHLNPTGGKTSVKYGVASTAGSGVANHSITPEILDDGRLLFELPLGFKEELKNKPRPGLRGRLQVIASPWNTE